MTKYLQIIFIFLLVLTSFSFFGANFLNKSFVNYTVFLFVLSAILISTAFVFKKGGGFNNAIRLIILSILISVLMAYFSWGQSIAVSLTYTMPFLLWVFFFYLLHLKIRVDIIEKIVLIYTVVYLILYFYQWTHPQTILFGKPVTGDDFDDDRGILRIIFPGGGIFFLGVFLALNKLTTQKSGRWFWLLLSILGLLVPILQATRQFIAGVVLIYVFHFMRKASTVKRIIVCGSFVLVFFCVAQSNIPVIKGLMAAQEETAKEGSHYIRVQSSTYFLTQFSPNFFSKVMGNGMPGPPELSSYGRVNENLYAKGYFIEDDGIIGMYTLFGVLAVIGYIIIWFKSLVLPLPGEYYYAKYYLWFLLIISFTSDGLYRPYYLISTIFALYIYQATYEKMQMLFLLKSYVKQAQ